MALWEITVQYSSVYCTIVSHGFPNPFKTCPTSYVLQHPAMVELFHGRGFQSTRDSYPFSPVFHSALAVELSLRFAIRSPSLSTLPSPIKIEN